MTPPLLIDLAGVARLADVRRPVASMWRTRSAATADPFPPVVSMRSGHPVFDAMSVARWLHRTNRGNNPEVIADAAASAAPADFDVSNAAHVAGVDALLALRATLGRALNGMTKDERERHAAIVDPDDTCLVTELATAHESWQGWADLLADAAYSPTLASSLLERRHAATRSSAGSSGPLARDGEALLVALGEALMRGHTSLLALGDGVTPSLAAEFASRAGHDVDVVAPSLAEGRGIRRRFLCEGLGAPLTSADPERARLLVTRFPSASIFASQVLPTIDELVLTLGERDRTIVLAPAAALVDRVSSSEDLARADALRSGRVRAIVRLPAGLVSSAPREPLALWVLGREVGDVPIAERFTAVADLTEVALTVAAQADLTSDVLAAMGGVFDVRAHAFRFVRIVRTTSLLASRGPLVSGATASANVERPVRDLPALLDAARAALSEDAPPAALAVSASEPAPIVATADIESLMAERHLKVLAGTRIPPDEQTTSGLVVVWADDLDDPAGIGRAHVDALAFAARHPSARLTEPGDVVFRTAPTAKAWVDPDGSKVVAHPARVLRIDRADPGGLVPELVAADIARSPAGPGAWRRWRLRRVAPSTAAPFRAALADIAARRDALTHRIDALDDYADLLVAGVVAGAVTLTEHAADAASEPQ